MPKPRRTIRPTVFNLSIPEDLRARLDLALWDEIEGRVPHGRYTAYICGLIRDDLDSRQHRLAAAHVPFVGGPV